MEPLYHWGWIASLFQFCWGWYFIRASSGWHNQEIIKRGHVKLSKVRRTKEIREIFQKEIVKESTSWHTRDPFISGGQDTQKQKEKKVPCWYPWNTGVQAQEEGENGREEKDQKRGNSWNPCFQAKETCLIERSWNNGGELEIER